MLTRVCHVCACRADGAVHKIPGDTGGGGGGGAGAGNDDGQPVQTDTKNEPARTDEGAR